MKIIITLMIILIPTIFVHGQNMYSKTFGNNKDKPILFLHGGPGYNSVTFEATTAQQLSENGFFVIVYDRRGEGRSKDPKAQFTFKETFDDIHAIYKKYGIEKSTLIGHSFGGIVATLFADAYPERVHSVILVGAPVSLQTTFKNIISKSKNIYQSKKDSVNLNYVSLLETMDTTSITYSSYCFLHAMQNGFYTPTNPTEEAKSIYSTFKTDTLLTKYASQMTYEPPQGFWKNEKYTTISLTNNIRTLLKNDIYIYALYGKDDGLYSNEQVTELQNLIGWNHLIYFDNCSHSVFIDQQTPFIDAIKIWIN